MYVIHSDHILDHQVNIHGHTITIIRFTNKHKDKLICRPILQCLPQLACSITKQKCALILSDLLKWSEMTSYCGGEHRKAGILNGLSDLLACQLL